MTSFLSDRFKKVSYIFEIGLRKKSQTTILNKFITINNERFTHSDKLSYLDICLFRFADTVFKYIMVNSGQRVKSTLKSFNYIVRLTW